MNTDRYEQASAALAQLGFAEDMGEIELLSEGASGAWSMRVSLPHGAAVLKIVTAAADTTLRQRAQREVAFYRELAAHLPVPTPHLLGAQADSTGNVLLLIEAYEAPRTLQALSATQMEALVSQIATLHAAFWGQHDLSRRYPWLRPGSQPGEQPDLAPATQLWQAQADTAALREVITPAILDALPAWFQALTHANDLMQAWPCTLVHGDCHLGNVLWSADGPIWGDWQEVGLGLGPADMSFLLQRACGPQDDDAFAHWSERYATLLAGAVAPGVAPADTLRLMEACELHMRLIEWPHYFDWLPPEAVAHQLARARRLVARFAAG